MIGFWNVARREPDVVAIIEAETGRSVTRGELAAMTHQLVHALRRRGVEANDVVAAVMDNRIESVTVFLAAMQAGLYFVPINYHLTDAEIAYIVEDSETKALFTTPEYAAKTLKAAQSAGVATDSLFCTESTPGFVNFADALAAEPSSEPDGRAMGLMMTYTSGTTGKPKGIKRPASGANPDDVGMLWSHPFKIFGIGEEYQVQLIQSPYYHTAVLNFANASAQYGHTLVLMNDWDAEVVLGNIEKYRVTTSHMVPTHFHRLLKLDQTTRAKYDVTSMKYVMHGAAPCPVETKQAMIAWLGPVLYEYYGASEGGGTTVNSTEWMKYPGTVGRPYHGAEIRILDEEGNPVPAGTEGLVWMLSGAFEFKYHNAPDKTKASTRDGFFTVGDLGHVNEEGYLFLHGRASDIIITGGVNVHPSEVEAIMQQHPQVADVAVFGLPDPEWGEFIQCVVQPVAGVAGSPELASALIAYCADHLARYKLPRKVDFVDQLPRDPNGKLYKRLIRDSFIGR
ncbi:MAG: AMP-binding protein [Ilumatobacteraceae bacterium]